MANPAVHVNLHREGVSNIQYDGTANAETLPILESRTPMMATVTGSGSGTAFSEPIVPSRAIKEFARKVAGLMEDTGTRSKESIEELLSSLLEAIGHRASMSASRENVLRVNPIYISLAVLAFTLVSSVASAAYAYGTMSNRVSNIETKLAGIETKVQAVDGIGAVNAKVDSIQHDLDRISKLLDERPAR